MKKWYLVLTVMLTLSLPSVKGQSIAQLTTQLILDIQKLSELKVILQDMYKSYQIIDKGYTDIKNIAEGNFNLHKLFLDGLLAVSPTVRNYQKVVDIINTQQQIVKEYKSASKVFKSGNIFSSQELDYIGKVYSNLFNLGLKDLDELAMVMTDSELRMSDAERLSAIDRINKDMQDKLSFLRRFNNNTSVQALQRAREQNDIGTMRSLYGITQ
ncbi:MAG: hypothetical protein BGO55_06220 [Sphingobacteriales bacterium 50-39]|nr:TerB family tellurite resistance protein [Sphingobacteriales bacterium]OJW52859.1 MAG: hypothetical protein BGO55_06220 [Sphingobacteriales bacterium 50-39]